MGGGKRTKHKNKVKEQKQTTIEIGSTLKIVMPENSGKSQSDHVKTKEKTSENREITEKSDIPEDRSEDVLMESSGEVLMKEDSIGADQDESFSKVTKKKKKTDFKPFDLRETNKKENISYTHNERNASNYQRRLEYKNDSPPAWNTNMKNKSSGRFETTTRQETTEYKNDKQNERYSMSWGRGRKSDINHSRNLSSSTSYREDSFNRKSTSSRYDSSVGKSTNIDSFDDTPSESIEVTIDQSRERSYHNYEASTSRRETIPRRDESKGESYESYPDSSRNRKSNFERFPGNDSWGTQGEWMDFSSCETSRETEIKIDDQKETPISKDRGRRFDDSTPVNLDRSRGSRTDHDDSTNQKRYSKRSGDRSAGSSLLSHGLDSSDSFYSKSSFDRSLQTRDLDFDEWERMASKNIKMETMNVIETFGDLFLADDEYSLGHCVAEDLNMGSGIAVTFRSMFKRVDELLNQRVTQGGVAILDINTKKGTRYIYYLVTKRRSSGKPTYETLFRSLAKMKNHVIENGIKKIALPRIGCGLDGLEWNAVKLMLQYIFKDVDVDIKVYNFQQGSDNLQQSPKPRRKCPVVNVIKPITEIEVNTIILYLCSAKLHVTKEMEDLDRKFNMLKAYKSADRKLGSVIRSQLGFDYIIYGLVVKEKPDSLIDYCYFQKAISEVNKLNKKEKYEYIALQGFKEESDWQVVSKLVNLMRNTFLFVDVYICWPKELAYLAPKEYDY